MRDRERQSQAFAKHLHQHQTEAEKKLWYELKGKKLGGYKFRRQMPIGRYIVDFACISERLIIEVDGATHGSLEERKKDNLRTGFLSRENWRVIRFTNEDILGGGVTF